MAADTPLSHLALTSRSPSRACGTLPVRRSSTYIWQCLEIAFTARVVPQDFSRGGRGEAAAAIQALFERRNGAGMTAVAEELGLSRQATPVAVRWGQYGAGMPRGENGRRRMRTGR
jgi:hypothetical protein